MLRLMKTNPVNSDETGAVSGAVEQAQKAASTLIDLIERRRVPRAVPHPEAVELDSDTGWAMWQQSMVAFSASAT